MRRRARRADELNTARRLLASAERDALDEVVAIRAEATQMLEAARQEAARLRAEATDHAQSRSVAEAPSAGLALAQTELEAGRRALDADREILRTEEASVRAEQTAIDAVRRELQTLRDDLDERSRAGTGDGSLGARPSAHTAELLASTRADLAALVDLLDGLAGRAAPAGKGQSEAAGEL